MRRRYLERQGPDRVNLRKPTDHDDDDGIFVYLLAGESGQDETIAAWFIKFDYLLSSSRCVEYKVIVSSERKTGVGIGVRNVN